MHLPRWSDSRQIEEYKPAIPGQSKKSFHPTSVTSARDSPRGTDRSPAGAPRIGGKNRLRMMTNIANTAAMRPAPPA